MLGTDDTYNNSYVRFQTLIIALSYRIDLSRYPIVLSCRTITIGA